MKVPSHSQQQQAQSTPNPPATVSDALDHAKRALALRKYEQAVEHYATALELLFVPLHLSPLLPRCRLKYYRHTQIKDACRRRA